MAYIVTRNPRGKNTSPHVPAHPDTDEGWPVVMRYGGGYNLCWADDVEDLIAVLSGDPATYQTASEQERLVTRIHIAIRHSVFAQAAEIHDAQLDGRWDRLTVDQQEMLLSPRHVQPAGLHEDLFGEPTWVADIPLIVVGTGYAPHTDMPMPTGTPANLIVLDPLTPEALLDSLADDLGAIQIYLRAVDG